MKIIKNSWSDISKEPISNDAIRALHLPTETYTYRFSPHEYKSGVRFLETVGMPHLVYVLSGNCKFEYDDQHFPLKTAELAEKGKGKYWFDVVGDEPVKIVNVFQIPRNLKH
jgi:hypothetical protein